MLKRMSLNVAVMMPIVLTVFILLSSDRAFAGCTKDTDCKGDRICTKGECMNPEPSKAGANQAGKMPAPGGPCKSYKNKLRAVDPGFTCVTSQGVTFKLIVRTDSDKEVWQDVNGKSPQTKGVYISDTADEKYDWNTAQGMCTDPATLDARGNLSNVSWHLPSGYNDDFAGQNGLPNGHSEFAKLDIDGYYEVVPSLPNHMFWTSSPWPPNTAWGYNGDNGGFADFGRQNEGSIRCIGKEK